MKILMLVNWKVLSCKETPNDKQPPDYRVEGEPYWFYRYFNQKDDVDIIDISSVSWLENFEREKLRFYVLQLPKADKMEFIVQKLVELGAYRIVPVALKRSVVHLDEKKAKARQARWQSIAEAAAKQSKRRIVPEVGAVCTLKEALEQTKEMDLKLIPYELSEGMMRTKKLIESAAPGQEIGVFIGPEGGFEEAEVALAMQSGFMPVTLGKRILRTETAGLTVMAWLMYQLEDSGIS